MSVLEPRHLQALRAMVRQRSGICLDSREEFFFEPRVLSLMQSTGATSVDALIAQLQARDAEPLRCAMVETMTTNETSFFRDAHPFDALRETVLPALWRARGAQRTLDLWCAAASTGQEPYSLAITLRENLPAASGWRIRVLATDLSERVLDRARAGVYSDTELRRGMPDAQRRRWFEPCGERWQVRPEVRELVEFRRLNLNGPWPAMPRMDVVLLRNVMIYFADDDKRSILARARRLLADDGVLFLGTGETTLGLTDEFERVPAGRATWYRPLVPGAAR